MKQAIKNRIRVTKTGKIMRRAMGIGHSKTRKNSVTTRRKRLQRKIQPMDIKTFKRYF
jgi:Ribosomal protein L35.